MRQQKNTPQNPVEQMTETLPKTTILYRICMISVALSMLLVAVPCRGDNMFVQVRQSPVRVTPSFLGQIVGEVHYGDELAVVEDRDAWMQINREAVKGWLHRSAVRTKKIELVSTDADVDETADQSEVVLAGKGFNADVEEAFRADNQANYEAIDLLESYRVTNDQKYLFLHEGELAGVEVMQ